MAIDKKNANRVMIIGVLALAIILFVLVNTKTLFTSAIIYIAFTLSFLLLIRKGSSFIGIDNTIAKDVTIGVFVGIAFIVLSFTGLSIGVPDLPQSIEDTNRFLMIGGVAPIAEEGVFRGIIQGMLLNVAGLSPIIGIPIQAIAFSIFHITAYGSIGVQTGAFVGAFIFGLVAGILAWKTKSLIPGMVAHAIFNGFLITKLVVAI